MSFLGNILWFIFGGFLAFLGYAIGALALCLTIVGIPFGVQCWKIGVAVLWPFGKTIHTAKDGDSPLYFVFNILWLMLFGLPIAASHLVSAGVLAITIIGLPFAWQHLKLIPLSLLPFGRELR